MLARLTAKGIGADNRPMKKIGWVVASWLFFSLLIGGFASFINWLTGAHANPFTVALLSAMVGAGLTFLVYIAVLGEGQRHTRP